MGAHSIVAHALFERGCLCSKAVGAIIVCDHGSDGTLSGASRSAITALATLENGPRRGGGVPIWQGDPSQHASSP